MVLAVLLAGNLVWAQSTIRPHDRLRANITESERVTLPGNVHPALARAKSVASVDASFPMEHMILLLQPEPAQQTALDALVAQQHDPHSSLYRQFLAPQQYAERFGVSQNDIDKITEWLTQQGFQVEEVTPNHLSIVFSGDAYAVQTAFNTEVKQYRVNGEVHYANASDPQIPAALAGVVKGVVRLHDFHARSSAQGLRVIGDSTSPMYTASPTTHYLAPADWAMIYNVRPLYATNLTGLNQSIAIVGRSNIKLDDIQSFRSQFGLPANNPTIIVAQGADPGFTNDGDSTEATLDAEWAGAIAPNSQVKMVISRSTSTADGVELAAMYAVNHNVAPVLSVSFGACEADMGASAGASGGTELAFYNSLWQQAASQGISVFVSSGDSGAAGCDSSGASKGTARAINGICSSPYATCVGGTEFKEGTNPGLYWLAGNNPVLGTAQSYIPEVVWNESGINGGSDLAGGGGGASIQAAKPSWQTGPGVPVDGHRDVPDVALTAAGHDGYLIFYNGSLSVVGGTSAAAPSFASLFTIINQKYNSSQGNPNPVLYPLAVKQSQGGAAVFHDITSGNNTVPGVSGYAAGAGYDLASGLGSVDAFQLVNHWQDVSLNGTFTLAAAPTALSVQSGQNITASLTVAISDGFNWPVAFTVSGASSGVTPTFSKASFSAPGSGTTSLQFAAGSSAAAGSYTVTVTATGGGISKTATLVLTVTAIVPQCSLTASTKSLSMGLSQATNVRLSCTAPQGKLPSTLALAVSGQPTGVKATFSSATLVPGTGVSNLTITTPANATAGAYTLAITAAGGTFSQTIILPFTLIVPPSISLSLSNSSVLVVQGTPVVIPISLADIGTFSAVTSLSSMGLPTGMTGSFSPASLPAPGAGLSTLTLQPSLTTPPGKYVVNVVASGGGVVKSLPVSVTVLPAPGFSFALGQAAYAVQAGQASGSVTAIVSNLTSGFNAPVTLSIAGLPTGVTGTFNSSTLAAPGLGSRVLTLAAAAVAVPGQYKLSITAAGGTISKSASLLLTVIGLPGFTVKTDVSSIALTAGAAFTTNIKITGQNGFNAPVTLSLGAIPAGITATLSTTTISGVNGTAQLQIQTASTLANGTYSLSVSGTSALVATALPGQTATVPITIGSVSTTLSASSLSIKRGTSSPVTVSVVPTNFTGSILFSASGYPANISYSFSPTALAGSGSTKLTITAGASALANNTFTLMVRTGAGGTVTQTPLTVTIN
jgi:uncharacterized membrane protein